MYSQKKLLSFIIFSTLVLQGFAQKLPDLIPYRSGKLWGYCDSNKKIIIKPKYELSKPEYRGFIIYPFFKDTDQKLLIVLGEKEIIIDRKGKEYAKKSLPPNATISRGDESGIITITINRGGDNPIDMTPYELFANDNSLFIQPSDTFKYQYPIADNIYRCYADSENGKKLMDKSRIIIYEGYRHIWPVDTLFLLVRNDGQCLLGNRLGKIITDSVYDEIEANMKYEANERYYMKKDEDKRTYSSLWGKYLVVRKGLFYGIISMNGKQVVPPKKYKRIYCTENNPPGIFDVLSNKGFDYIDYKGTEYWKD
jgi:hypothetical protein